MLPHAETNAAMTIMMQLRLLPPMSHVLSQQHMANNLGLLSLTCKRTAMLHTVTRHHAACTGVDSIYELARVDVKAQRLDKMKSY